MFRFNLVRLPNNDLLLSSGSNIPVLDVAANAGSHVPAFPQSHLADMGDLMLMPGSGLTVDA